MDSEVSVNNKTIFDGKLKSYYETISSTDQKRSITDDNNAEKNYKYLKVRNIKCHIKCQDMIL